MTDDLARQRGNGCFQGNLQPVLNNLRRPDNLASLRPSRLRIGACVMHEVGQDVHTSGRRGFVTASIALGTCTLCSLSLWWTPRCAGDDPISLALAPARASSCKRCGPSIKSLRLMLRGATAHNAQAHRLRAVMPITISSFGPMAIPFGTVYQGGPK